MCDNVGKIPSISERTNSFRERLLGAFVVFQLIYLPLSNYIKLLPVRSSDHAGELTDDPQRRIPSTVHCREPYQTVVDATAWCCSRWAELSGQIHSWALFASYAERASLPIVELQWSANQRMAKVRIKSQFEPANPTRYFHWPQTSCRKWNYEYRMAVFHMAATRELIPDDAQYRQLVLDNVSNMRRSMAAYLNWQVRQYLAANSGMPQPEYATLLARVIPIPAPGQSRDGRPAAFEIPVARWYSDPIQGDARDVLQAWDPIHREFVRLRIEEAR